MKNRTFFFSAFFSAIFFFTFFSAPLYAGDAVDWLPEGKPKISAQWGTSFPFKKDLRNPSPAEEFIAGADWRELRYDSGIKYQCNQFDYTSRFFYMPTFFDAFQTGFGLTWHFQRYIDVFTENDIVLSTHFRWIKGRIFSCELGPGLLFKFASIDAVRKYQPVLFNLSYSLDLLCRWQLFDSAGLWCGVQLQDYFDYALAISPFIKFGADYSVVPGLIFGIDYTLKYIDMFYSAVYLSESVLRFTAKVTF